MPEVVTNGKGPATVSVKDFRTDAENWWCPGCGDFGVLAALHRALAGLGLRPENVVVVAGIGCSGKIGNYIHCVQLPRGSRAHPAAAMGIKLANKDLTVLAVGGDGDGFAIGMGHFMHAVRRNPNITYVVMDNHIYGLTKGQVSPTSGWASRPARRRGQHRAAGAAAAAGISAGATFVAQGFSSDVKQLADLIRRGSSTTVSLTSTPSARVYLQPDQHLRLVQGSAVQAGRGSVLRSQDRARRCSGSWKPTSW